MATLKVFKSLISLPDPLEANSIYFVRAGRGFDLYVTNNLGVVNAYSPNVDKIFAGNYTANWPVDAPGEGQLPIINSSGHFSWWKSPFKELYVDGVVQDNFIIWLGNAQTINGTVVVYPTDNNQVDGNPIFSQIYHPSCEIYQPSANPNLVAIGSFRSATLSNRVITFNAVKPNQIMLAGTSFVSAPDGLDAKVTLIGVKA